MKTKKISICLKCGFQANEKLRVCPICLGSISYQSGEEVTAFSSLPKSFEHTNKDVKILYYCYKCQQLKHTRICLKCNLTNYLVLNAFGKILVVNKSLNLEPKFTQDEIEKIALSLSLQEKHYLYYHFASNERFFYRKDLKKASVCFFLSIFCSLFFLDIAVSMREKMIYPASFFFLALGFTFLGGLLAIGFCYLVNANSVENHKTPYKVFLNHGILELCVMLYNFLLLPSLLVALYISGGALIISLVLDIILLKRGKNEN